VIANATSLLPTTRSDPIADAGRSPRPRALIQPRQGDARQDADDPADEQQVDDGEASRRSCRFSRNEALLLCHLADTVPARHTSAKRRAVSELGDSLKIARMTLCVS